MRFGAARVRRCGVGREADAVVGADVVTAGGSFPTVEVVSAPYGPASGSLALMAGSHPLSGTANKSPPVAASTRDHGCCCRGRWRVARNSSPCRLPGVEVVHTRGDGTGVPFVMAP